MGNFTLAPVPLKEGLSQGFWVDLQDKMNIAIQVLTDNTAADVGSGETGFDQTENTVSEFMVGVASIISNKY